MKSDSIVFEKMIMTTTEGEDDRQDTDLSRMLPFGHY